MATWQIAGEVTEEEDEALEKAAPLLTGCAFCLCLTFGGCLIAGLVLLSMGLVQHGDASALSPLEDFEALGKVCNITRLTLCTETVVRSENCGKNCYESVTR